LAVLLAHEGGHLRKRLEDAQAYPARFLRDVALLEEDLVHKLVGRPKVVFGNRPPHDDAAVVGIEHPHSLEKLDLLLQLLAAL
jgi:hypothetical protein